MAPTVRSFFAEFDPLDLLDQYPEDYPGLLESGSRSGVRSGARQDAATPLRHDILPIASGEVLRLDASYRLSGPHAGADGFLNALQRWWSSLAGASDLVPLDSRAPALPFTGGWLLYLGYEIGTEIESGLPLPPSEDPLVALAIRAPAAYVRAESGAGWLVAEPGYEHLLENLERRVQTLRPTQHGPFSEVCVQEQPAAPYLQAVQRALAYISAGDVYQANLSREWRTSIVSSAGAALDPVAIYRRLRTANPGPFAGVLRYGDFSVLSSSPERLLHSRDGRVSTRPIAGTRPRGLNAADDEQLVASLLANEKERAEHIMLIDLERNDLGRVCEGGSVRVDEFMHVESYAHVHHIVSNVCGNLRAGCSPVEVIKALFPGGTITGCPKVRCMQIIAELEGRGRGAYTGSFGYLNRDGSCDLNILIRTMTLHGNTLSFRAGAGIVADSIPAQELAETRAKAEGLLRALQVPP